MDTLGSVQSDGSSNSISCDDAFMLWFVPAFSHIVDLLEHIPGWSLHNRPLLSRVGAHGFSARWTERDSQRRKVLSVSESLVFRLKGRENIWWAADDIDGLNLQFGRGFAGPGSIVIPGDAPGVDTVSRRHFRFSRVRGAYWVEDLGSENLTVVLHRSHDGRVSERIAFSATETSLPCEVRAGDLTVQIRREAVQQNALEETSHYLRSGPETLHTTIVGTSVSPYGRTELRWAAAVNEISTLIRRETDPELRVAGAAELVRKYFRAARAVILPNIDADGISSALSHCGFSGWTDELAKSLRERLQQTSASGSLLRIDMPGNAVVVWTTAIPSAPNNLCLAAVDFAGDSLIAAALEKADRLVDITLKFILLFADTEKEVARSHETVRGLTNVQLSDSVKAHCSETGFCYHSQASRELLRVLELVGTRLFQGERLPLPVVLLQGERGAGKTKLASLLRKLSARASAPLVEQNCATIPHELAESILFGHKKGAFTHATADRPGLFETARGGILFLDEIGDLPRDLQPKLLTVLETGKYRPIGETSERTTNCYIVTASNKDLQRLCRDGAFREDLYDRIATVRIEVPPLRERRDDIPHLARTFLAAMNHGQPPQHAKQLSKNLLSQLSNAAWPGNARQLRSVIENIYLFSPTEKQVIDLEDVPSPMQAELRAAIGATEVDTPVAVADYFSLTRDLRWNVARFEREYLIRLFVLNKGKKGKTIAAAGMNHNVFYDRLKAWRKWIEDARDEDQDEIARLRDLAGEYWDRLWIATDDDKNPADSCRPNLS